jgi:serine/threonine-protein kinase
LHPQLLTDRTFAQRFRREARALAGMRHPNIITVYEVGEADGRLYIAMELANGSSLAQTLADRGRLAWNEMLAILKSVCDALDYAHAQGIVHRDLKPANILLDKDRGALLTDFGFARIMGESSMSMSLSGGILGTPAYIAPEVWELEVAKPAADIYALGCIVYEMLTGQVLFTGTTPMQIMRAHDQGPQWSPAPTWSADAPAGVETVLRQALARQPEARYPSASAVWQALNDLEADAQANREQSERAATAAQWRTETEAALAAGQWSAARMAVGRWLAITPDDPAAQAARAQIERRQVAAQADSAAQERARQAAQRQAQEEAARKAGQDQIRQAREAAFLAEQKARQEKAAQAAPSPYTPAPAPKRRLPTWAWIGGGAVLLACVIFGLAGFALFRPFSSAAVPAPDSTQLLESTQPPDVTQPPDATQTPDATLPPTDAPLPPTDAPVATATLAPAATPLRTATVIPATVRPAPAAQVLQPTAVKPAPVSAATVANEPRTVTLSSPVNGTQFKSPVITFKWSGGALQPGETFLVEIRPVQANKGGCTEEYGRAGINTSGPLTDHEWTTNITQVPPNKAQPCPGRIEWLVYVRDANGNILQSTPLNYLEWNPLL